jgi:hypothetical protein
MTIKDIIVGNRNIIGLISAVGLILVILLFGNTGNPPVAPGSDYSSAYTSTSYTESFSSVTDSTYYEIRATGELLGTERAVNYVSILSAVHSTKTPADYDGTVCCVYWDTTLIGCVSQFLGGEASFSADKRSTGTNLTFACTGLGNSGSDIVKVGVSYTYR